MAGNRMSPQKQIGARAALEADLANVHTGDADVDSLLAREVGRRAAFAVPAPATRKPYVSPFKRLGDAFAGMFKPAKAKPKGK